MCRFLAHLPCANRLTCLPTASRLPRPPRHMLASGRPQKRRRQKEIPSFVARGMGNPNIPGFDAPTADAPASKPAVLNHQRMVNPRSGGSLVRVSLKVPRKPPFMPLSLDPTSRELVFSVWYLLGVRLILARSRSGSW